MKLWILEPIDYKEKPWQPWYDKVFELIIRAEDENEARGFAADACGVEGRDAWLDSSLSSCDELTTEGQAGVILVDYRAA